MARIAALEKLIEYCNENILDGYVDTEWVKQIAQDALDQLKEQETIFLRDGHHIRCMHCGEYWCDRDREGDLFPMNFCPNCGKAAKWNEQTI